MSKNVGFYQSIRYSYHHADFNQNQPRNSILILPGPYLLTTMLVLSTYSCLDGLVLQCKGGMNNLPGNEQHWPLWCNLHLLLITKHSFEIWFSFPEMLEILWSFLPNQAIAHNSVGFHGLEQSSQGIYCRKKYEILIFFPYWHLRMNLWWHMLRSQKMCLIRSLHTQK